MPVLEAEGRSFADVEHVGLAIHRTHNDGLHSGILYKLDGEEPRILHLAFHHDLRDDPASVPFRWVQIGLDDVNKLFLAELVARIARRQPQIAYGFNSGGVAIDPETGDILPSPPGCGLTCATFITTVLRAHGYELIDVASWPERIDDIPFHEQIVTWLEPRASEEHVQAVREDIGARRLRPDEVVGAGSLSDDRWAVQFDLARAVADEIQADLPN